MNNKKITIIKNKNKPFVLIANEHLSTSLFVPCQLMGLCDGSI